MPTPPLPPLLIGSCEPFSGKSAVVLGLARQLSRLGIAITFGKPLATDWQEPGTDAGTSGPLLDADVRFIGDDAVPGAAQQDLGITRQQRPAGQDDVMLGDGLVSGAAFRAYQCQHPQVRGIARRFLLPVENH